MDLTYALALGASALAAVKRLRTWQIWLLVAAVLMTAPDGVRTWNHFHYYLNTRHLDHVGVFEFYECVAVALERDSFRRDLTDYGWNSGAGDCGAVDGERWNAFVSDARQFADYERLRAVMTDKGLNATPPWIALVRPLTLTLTPDQLALVDPLLLAVAFAVCWLRIGARRTGHALLFVLVFAWTHDRLFGNAVQYAWLALLLVAAAFSHGRGRQSWLAGAAIGVAASLRVFPIFYLWGKSRRTWAGAMAAGVAMGAVGLSAGGPGAYLDMLANMHLHGGYIRTEPLNMGLGNLLSLTDADAARRSLTAMIDGLPYQVPDACPGWYLAAPALIGAGWAGLLFGAVTLSRYYYTVLALLLLERDDLTRLLFGGNAVVLALMAVDPVAAATTGNTLVLALLVYMSVRGRAARPLRRLGSAARRRLLPV